MKTSTSTNPAQNNRRNGYTGRPLSFTEAIVWFSLAAICLCLLTNAGF